MKNLKELSKEELKEINGGISPLGKAFCWLLGKMFTTPAVLDKNGMNPVHLYN